MYGAYILTIKQAAMARIFGIKKTIIYQCHDSGFCSAVRYSYYNITWYHDSWSRSDVFIFVGQTFSLTLDTLKIILSQVSLGKTATCLPSDAKYWVKQLRVFWKETIRSRSYEDPKTGRWRGRPCSILSDPQTDAASQTYHLRAEIQVIVTTQTHPV